MTQNPAFAGFTETWRLRQPMRIAKRKFERIQIPRVAVLVWNSVSPHSPSGMRHAPIDPQLFIENRHRLKRLLRPNSIALLNANDILPTNADGSLRIVPNSDLFYLSGVEQEESTLLLFPDADDPSLREILFLRETSDVIAVWEGHKLTKDEARQISGIKNIQWTSAFPPLLHRLMCEAEHVYLNANEHKRAGSAVQTREMRFVEEIRRQFPLHHYHRLARLLHRLRIVKSRWEIDLLQQACAITEAGFRRVARFTRPGVNECEIEAEFIHEFTRRRATFAYSPIIAAGRNACILHYIQNDQPCRNGDLLLLDVGASYANYNSDLTRTIPVSGRFTPRQRRVYNAVLRVLRGLMAELSPARRYKDWQKSAEAMIEKELVDLGLLTIRDLRKQGQDRASLKRYFMHGAGHPLGLDVHDVGFTTEPFAPGWVMTIEPGIYIPEEQMAVRLENDVLITETGVVDLMAKIPIEADSIEELMHR